MRNFRLLFTFFGLTCLFLGRVMSQDIKVQANGPDHTLETAINSAIQNRHWQLAFNSPKGLASADSQYLAQDASELQTYEELGMQFHYLQSAAIRRQLKLPEEQGLLVKSVDTAKAGHKYGFVEGDLVLLVGSTPVDTQYDFVIAVNSKRGGECPVKILREGEPETLTIKLDPIDLQTLNSEGRWIIGVHVDSASDALQAQLLSTGVVINELTENAPAVAGGLKVHDVIARINGHQILNSEDLRKFVGESDGKPVRLEYYRGGKLQSLDLTPIKEQKKEQGWQRLNLSPHIYSLDRQPIYSLDRQQMFVELRLAEQTGALRSADAMAITEEPKLSLILKQIEQLSRDVQELKERIK